MSAYSIKETLHWSYACLRAFSYKNWGFCCHRKKENFKLARDVTRVFQSEIMADEDELSDFLSLESHESDDDSLIEANSNEELNKEDSIGGYQGAFPPCDVTKEVRTLSKTFRHGHTLDGRFAQFTSNLNDEKIFPFYLTLDNTKNKFLQISKIFTSLQL